MWWDKIKNSTTRFDNLQVIHFPEEDTCALAKLASRAMRLQINIQDGDVMVSVDDRIVYVNAPLVRRDNLALTDLRGESPLFDGPGAIARNEALRASKRFGRTIWRLWSGHHRRSRVETKMHFVKLLGQRLAARDFDRQVAEFQVRVAVLNGFTALGIPVTEVVG
jgi:hypothetical protein